MRKYVMLVCAMGALIAVAAVGIAAAAGGEGPVTVKVGEMELTTNGGFSPKVLSKTKQTPIAIKASGEVRMQNGGHPPAIREIVIETDKNGEAHTKGIPVCRSGQLQATDTEAALKACGSSLIGEGTAVAQVAFAEQKPIDVSSKLLLFNGPEKGGKTTWYAHVYFSNPISGAIVSTVTISKIHHGRFGTLGVVKIPQIAGGAGSGISFTLEIFKSVKVGNKTFNPISAKCSDGKLKVKALGKFEDGTQAQTEIVRACTPKG
ncbi:MAG TPA: hypothetical protein VHZ54_10065 [Solirubrobacterales bacterium]|jgi:hypothetical protein|nr:hypothetical protein [Solirubrobacterales bacterium]